MRLHTASEAVNFARRLEDESGKFYEDLSQRYTQDAAIFLSFAQENKKNIAQIERAYYGVITDAIEGCFAFNINPNEYTFESGLQEEVSYADALGKAIKIEEKMVAFYSDAAEQSKSLMADVTRNFVIVARKRNDRIPKLRSLIERSG